MTKGEPPKLLSFNMPCEFISRPFKKIYIILWAELLTFLESFHEF